MSNETSSESGSQKMKKRSEAKSKAKPADDVDSAVNAELASIPDEPPQLGTEGNPAPPEDDVRLSYEYPTVQKMRGEKPLRDDLGQIVETVFVQNMHADWKKLRAALRIGVDRSDHGTLQQALDNAEHYAHLAHRLMITAKIEFDRWEAENAVVFGAMWNDANKALQNEKTAGNRSKQITDADVKAKCATLYPDDWAAQEKKRRQVKLTIDSLENLAEVWASRCRSLQAMLAKLRG
jgi:hypothetical protein